MRTSVKLCLTALAAALLLASAVTSASAGTLRSSRQDIRTVWSSLEFTGGVTIRCRVTLEGSFHSTTIEKVRESLIGLVTKAWVKSDQCTNGRAWAENGVERAPLGTLSNTLPWHVTYFSFDGALPNITGVRLLLRRIRFVLEATILGLTCLGRYGNATDRIVGRVSRNTTTGEVDNLIPVAGENRANLVNQLADAVCPGTGTFNAPATDGVVTGLNVATKVTVTLI